MRLFTRKQRYRNRTFSEPSLARQVFYGVLTMFAIGGIVTGLWYVTRLDSLTISTISVEGGETIPHEEIQGIVDGKLSGSYALIIPHRFTFLFPKESILAAVAAVPRVHDVAVERSSRTGVHVTFTEYVPHALWCQSLEESGGCYFLTADGYAFAPAPELIGGSLIRYVLEHKGSPEKGWAIDSALLQRLDTLFALLDEAIGFRVLSVVHTTDGDFKLHISGGGMLFVAGTFDAERVVHRLQAVLASKEYKHLRPDNFNYIDLRFGQKVFVNEGMETASTTADFSE